MGNIMGNIIYCTALTFNISRFFFTVYLLVSSLSINAFFADASTYSTAQYVRTNVKMNGRHISNILTIIVGVDGQLNED